MNKRDEKLLKIFENVTDDPKIVESIIQLQNNINIHGNAKVIGVSSPKNDVTTLIAAKAIAEVYAMQNQPTLIIDCNMYNSLLQHYYGDIKKYLNDLNDSSKSPLSLAKNLNKNLGVIVSKNTTYPSEVFLSDSFHQLLEEAKCHYEHVVMILPSIINHNDIITLKNDLTAAVLVARKKQTKREDLFDSIELLKTYNVPYIGTIFMK